MTEGRFICGYIIEFADGSDAEQVLHTGTMEECKLIGERMPAVMYSGEKQPVNSRFVIIPAA